MSEPMLPPPLQMIQLVTGKWIAQALYATAELGIVDHLKDGPKTSEHLATLTQTHAPSLHRLLRALASIGVLTADAEGRYTATPLGETLRSDVPGSLRDMARMMGMSAMWRPWGEILHSLRTGKNAFELIHKENGFSYLSKHPEEAAIFDGAMTSFSSLSIPTLVASYDFSPYSTIVDVAGGRGHLLGAILKANPEKKGILFDMPHAIEGAKRHLATSGVAARCQTMGGDFFQSVPQGGDLYLLKHIIHDWDDERAETILVRCRRAMAKAGKLLVIEMVIPEGNDPFFGKLLDLEMLVVTAGGRERTVDQYRSLFERSGYVLNRVIPTQSPLSIIEGEPFA